MLKNIITFACLLSIVSCSSSSSTSGDNAVLTGVFVDSAVGGVLYSSSTQTGVTNQNGEFQYIDGESITFSIGSLDFPELVAQAEISPVNMSPTESIDDNVTINIARLLQSMDVDNNPNNGISISETASSSAIPLDFSQSPSEFSNDPDVINLVANSGSSSAVLIAPEVAIAHLSNTLGIADFIRIATLETFNTEVVDRVLLFENGDRLVITSNGTIDLLNDEGSSELGTWVWQDSLFCREVMASTGAPVSDCQIFEINGDQLRFTRDAGAGETITVTITS